METLKPIYNNIETLKPIIPEIIKCGTCKEDFKSFLKLNATPYKTCKMCRMKIRIQGQKHRDKMKQLEYYVKY